MTGLALGSVIDLNGLPSVDASKLAELQLSQVHGLASEGYGELVARLADRAEGNPLFIEELLGDLVDRGLGRPDFSPLTLDLPSTLRSLILDRIDRLGPRQQSARRRWRASSGDASP